MLRTRVDYTACYRILELSPGAPLKEIEEQARFLRVAFHPDKFQGHLKEHANERMKSINSAVNDLRAYWTGIGPLERISERHPRSA